MAVPTVNDDYNIQEAWDEVCRSFAKTTNLDLTAPAASKYTIDEVLQQIRIRQDEDEQRNAKYKLAKDAISKTLTCIEVLGGIAAQGASMVFGPSALCFNAVSYLIQAGAQFKRIFTGIADLFKRISDVLERCKIYLRMPPDAVDISLRRIINEEMLCFVDICALSTKVLKGNKALITLKIIAFNSDEGVSAQLARLAQLVERESQMRATLGFESQKSSEKAIVETREGTKTVTASVDKLLEYRQQDEKNSVAKKQLQEIDANLDNPSNNLTAMQGKYRDLTERKVEGSGKWILSDPVYTRWASKNAESPLGVLCLSGGEGYGKSYLFATIIRDLQERLSQAADDLIHSSTAFYFFEQGTATRGGAQYADSDSPLLVKALKTVAYQLATHDPVYRKSLVSSTKTLEGNQIPHLWDALFAKSYKTDSTFFILLDGADRISWENLKHLLDVLADLQKTSNTWDQFRLRILFSARDETVRRIKKKLDEGTSIIDVAANNSGDVEAFIKKRLSSMEIFSSDTSQVKALESEILERLLKTAQGDFVNIDLLLNEIGGKRRPGEIRDVLSRSGEKRSDTIARKVQRLNETLSENSISDLNELLVWVIHARCPLELGELEAVLYVKNGEPSLRSLADEINDKYSALFRIEGEANSKAKTIPTTATVSIVSESIKEYFSAKSASEEATSYDEIPTNGDVTESEVQIVRHFLNMVCEPKLFKKFDFDSFFERKLTKKTARLGFDNDTAHLRILLGCLKAITMEQTDLSSGLVDYATFYFYDHLDLIDLSLIQPRSKAIVGTQLVQTFTDEKTFTPWWTSNRLWMRDKWLYDDKRVDTVLKWLQDSAVTKKISEKDQEWIKSLSSKSKPDTDLLEHVARFIARKWLQDSYWDSQETFYWVNAYENKIANRKDPNVKRETDDPNPKGLTAARVHEIAEFSRPFLGLETLGYEETRNVARTLRNFGKLDDAVEAFKLAMSLEEDNWFAKWGLAQTYGEQKKYALAIQTIEEVKVSIEGGQAKAYEPRSHLNHVNRMLAGWYREIGNVDQAWEIYESILRDNPDDYETTYSMIVLLHGKGSYTMLFEFLEGLKKSVDETTGLDRCTQIFHEYYWKDEYHDTIAAAVRGTTGMMTLKESYLTAIDAAEKKVQRAKDQLDRYGETYAKSIMALLMHYYAKFFHKRHTSPEEKEVALDMWVRIIQLDASDNWQLLRAKSFATECLSSVYLQEALRAGQGTTLAAKFIDNLEHISSMRTDESEEDRTTKEYPLQLLARYHALSGETGKAKNALRAFVKSNIDLLSDDDPANDWQGYIGLAMHFMFAGQDDNSLAAWSLIVPNPEEQGNGDKDITVARETESAPQPETSESLEGPLDFYCDGKCGVTWTYANDVYVCRECADVQFDEACLKRLKEGSLNTEVCDESHEMLHVPKYDAEKLRRIGKGNVMVGQEIMTVQGWIQKIKQDWGLFVEDVK